MTRLVLDSSALGMLCHPKPRANRHFATALEGRLRSVDAPVAVYVPAIADYELRRKLLHLLARGQAGPRSLQRLDALCKTLPYLPLSTPVLRRAAEICADLRLRGLPIARTDSLDADAILAAQALEVDASVVTTNVRHLSRVVSVTTPE